MMTTTNNFKVVSFGQNRYAIVNEKGEIIDDAQGYGYKTAQNAYKALSWKTKSNDKKTKCAEWKKENPNAFKKIIELFDDAMESYFKEICNGITTEKEIWNLIEKELNLEIPTYIRSQAKNHK